MYTRVVARKWFHRWETKKVPIMCMFVFWQKARVERDCGVHIQFLGRTAKSRAACVSHPECSTKQCHNVVVWPLYVSDIFSEDIRERTEKQNPFGYWGERALCQSGGGVLCRESGPLRKWHFIKCRHAFWQWSLLFLSSALLFQTNLSHSILQSCCGMCPQGIHTFVWLPVFCPTHGGWCRGVFILSRSSQLQNDVLLLSPLMIDYKWPLWPFSVGPCLGLERGFAGQ